MFGKSTSKRFGDHVSDTPGPGQYETLNIGEIGSGIGNPYAVKGARFVEPKVSDSPLLATTPSKSSSSKDSATPVSYGGAGPAVAIARLKKELGEVQNRHDALAAAHKAVLAHADDLKHQLTLTRNQQASMEEELTKAYAELELRAKTNASLEETILHLTETNSDLKQCLELSNAATIEQRKHAMNLSSAMEEALRTLEVTEEARDTEATSRRALEGTVATLQGVIEGYNTKVLCYEHLLSNECLRASQLEDDFAATSLMYGQAEYMAAKFASELKEMKKAFELEQSEHALTFERSTNDKREFTETITRMEHDHALTVRDLEGRLESALEKVAALERVIARKDAMAAHLSEAHTKEVAQVRAQLTAVVDGFSSGEVALTREVASLQGSLEVATAAALSARQAEEEVRGRLAAGTSAARAVYERVASLLVSTRHTVQLWSAAPLNDSLSAEAGGVMGEEPVTTLSFPHLARMVDSLSGLVETLVLCASAKVARSEAALEDEVAESARNSDRLNGLVLEAQKDLQVAFDERDTLKSQLNSADYNVAALKEALAASEQAFRTRDKTLEATIKRLSEAEASAAAAHYDEVEGLRAAMKAMSDDRLKTEHMYEREIARLEEAVEAAKSAVASKVSASALQQENSVLKKEMAQLAAANAKLMASNNARQKIKYHTMIKEENSELRKKNLELSNKLMALSIQTHSKGSALSRKRISMALASASPASAARAASRTSFLTTMTGDEALEEEAPSAAAPMLGVNASVEEGSNPGVTSNVESPAPRVLLFSDSSPQAELTSIQGRGNDGDGGEEDDDWEYRETSPTPPSSPSRAIKAKRAIKPVNSRVFSPLSHPQRGGSSPKAKGMSSPRPALEPVDKENTTAARVPV